MDKKFNTIEELNIYLNQKKYISYKEWVEIITKNESLIDGETIKEVKKNYNYTNFSVFGYFFVDFINEFF